jgi:N-acetylmuramoyl-L-alanine amidase
MLESISNFFRSFFEAISNLLGGLFSSKKREPVIIREPDPEDLEPQDGGDIPQDTVITVDNDLEDEIIIKDPKEPPPPEIPSIDPSQPTPTEPEEEEQEAETGSKPRYLWCLDNGHGKLTAGKRSPKLKDNARFFEYEFNRIIVKGIIKELKKHGVKYYNVVPEVNVDNFLKGRVLRANNVPSDIPKIFLSIHSNAGPGTWTTAKGLETWYYHGSPTGKKLATVFQKHLVEKLAWTNRGIKSKASKQFYVLRKTNMPAILTENGFYNNKKEVYQLLDKKVQQKIIDAHVEAILYLEKH